MTLHLTVNGFTVDQVIDIFLMRPPELSSHYMNVSILQNVTIGTVILIAMVTTNNSQSMLKYAFTNPVVDSSPGYYFNVTDKGSIQVIRPIPNNLLNEFNLTLTVTDQLTNLSDTAIVQISIIDVNESPRCDIMMPKTKIYTLDAKVILAHVSCTDPDRTEKFTKLNYTVYAAPSSINVSIDQSGIVMLTEKVPINLKSFDIFVTVQNIDFVVYSNFSVSVINDVPSCSVSKNVLLLWESKPIDVINVTCETVDPGNVHSINYTGFDISFQDLFNVSMISNNNKTVLVNVTIRKYSPAVANITLYLDVNQIQTETSLTVFLSNPPKFLFYYKKVDVMQNLTTGSAIVNISATSDNSRSVLNYSLTSISVDGSPSQYFTIDEKGSIKILQPITNELIGTFNLTVQVKDTLTNLTDSAIVEVNILDVNESPVCVVVFNVASVYTTANWTKLAHINCTDPDKYPEYTKLNYSVKTVPSTVNVLIDKSGIVNLTDKAPINLPSFDIFVTVQNIEFMLYFNFSLKIINDVPSCTVSKPILLLLDSNKSDVVNVTCETFDPGNIHRINYTGFVVIPQDLINITMIFNNNKTVLFNVTLSRYSPSIANVKDTLTNLTDSAIVEVNILDVNESPVCVVVFNVASVYTTANWTKLAHINCTDPDKYPEYTKLNYSVKTVPSTVNVLIDKSGIVNLTDKAPINLPSFDIFVTVQNIEFMLYFNFSLKIINDVPSCTVSKPILLLLDSNKSDVVNVTCETFDPGNIHRINYTGFVVIPQDLINITMIFNNNKTVLFNVTLSRYSPSIANVKDTLTNLTDSAIVEVNILDVNESPVCVVVFNVASVYTTANWTKLAHINCTDPDKYPEYTKLNYSVKTVPSTVNVLIDKSGIVNLTDKAPINLPSFDIFVTVQNIEFMLYFNFSLKIINDVPTCTISNPVLLLWELKTSDLINEVCDTIDPGHVHSILFSGFKVMPQDFLSISMISIINETVTLNVTLNRYSPTSVNVTINLVVNGYLIAQNITLLVYNPPKLTPVITHILQNITSGSQILNVSATTVNHTALRFHFQSTSLDGYFEIDYDTGILRSISNIPNSLVGSINFTIMVNDTRTGLSSSENFTIEIEDVNEPPVCLITDDTVINSSVNPIFHLAKVIILFFSSFIVGQSGPFIVGQSGPFIVGQSGPFIVGQSGPFIVGQSGSFIVGQSGPFIVGQSGPFIVGQSGPFIVGQSGPSIVG
ncbi:hypothetical protein Btru_000476 [Bulinus truncatus]|nr:hypothetical protein Btru_000476 [Bulinus truncatus]